MGGSAKYREAHSKYKRKGFESGPTGGQLELAPGHFPVEANVRIKNKTTEGALSEFRKQHVDSDHEWAYIIDDQGYVHEYNEGGRHSVGVNRVEGGRLIHNHPSGSAFSREDLEVFASRDAQSITASGKRFDYTIERGTHFKKQEFLDALHKANLVGSDYNDAVDKWLSKNARKYGYKYSRTEYDKNGDVKKVKKSSTKPRSGTFMRGKKEKKR